MAVRLVPLLTRSYPTVSVSIQLNRPNFNTCISSQTPSIYKEQKIHSSPFHMPFWWGCSRNQSHKNYYFHYRINGVNYSPTHMDNYVAIHVVHTAIPVDITSCSYTIGTQKNRSGMNLSCWFDIGLDKRPTILRSANAYRQDVASRYVGIHEGKKSRPHLDTQHSTPLRLWLSPWKW